MLEEKILQDYRQAMKNSDKLRSSILNFVRAQLKNISIAKKGEKLEDAEVIAVLKKEAKRHEESIEQFKNGQRPDLAEKEIKELEILKTYLPACLGESEITKIINAVLGQFPGTLSGTGTLSSTSATMKEMGQIMKEVMSKVAGRADGKLVSALVRKMLVQSES